MNELQFAETLIGAVAVLATVVQVSPIKIDPWTWLFRALGRALNHDTNEKVDKLSKDVSSLRAEMLERDAVNARVRILRFGDECRLGVDHSKDYFDQIEMDITAYENYCKEHPEFRNNMTSLTIEHINSVLKRCLEKNNLL